MKKVLLMMLVMTASALTSCNEDDIQYFEWQKVDYEYVKQKGLNYYKVPQEGGEFVFICNNYEPKVGGVDVQKADGTAFYSYNLEYVKDVLDIDIQVNKVTINVKPNYGCARSFTVEFVNDEGVYSRIPFTQEAGEEVW